MRSRRKIIIWIVGIIVVLWLIASSSNGVSGPIPTLSSLLRTGQVATNTATTDPSATQDIELPDTALGLANQPVSALQYLPKSGRFLAYGLNDQTVYAVSSAALSSGLYRHGTTEELSYAQLNASENDLLVVTMNDSGIPKIITINLTSGQRSEAAADVLTANWMPDGRLVYTRLQQDRVSVYITSGGNFNQSAEVARVPLAYQNAAVLPSPNNAQVAVVASSEFSGETLGAQIIYLAEKTISKFGTDIASATWSPDSKYLFGMSTNDLVNRDNPTMYAWDVATKKTIDYANARWFPHELTAYPNKDGVYWTTQTGVSNESELEVWAITVVDSNKQQTRSVNLTPKLTGSIALFGLTTDRLLGLGSDSVYQTAVKPLLDEAQKILP
jgi:hypothetical protein